MLHRLMDFKSLKKISPILILLFGVFASAQLPPFSFLKSSSTASVAPTGLALTHSTRNRGFTVSWTAGSGNNGAGGCKLQYYQNGTTWTDLAGTYNCDSTTTNAAANLPSGDNWTNNFNGTGVQVRILRISDSTARGTFTQRTTCTTTSGSASSTPTIDEDCDARWNNTTSEPTTISQQTWSHWVNIPCGGSYDCNAVCSSNGGGSPTPGGQIGFSSPSINMYSNASCTTIYSTGGWHYGYYPSGAPPVGTTSCYDAYHNVDYGNPACQKLSHGDYWVAPPQPARFNHMMCYCDVPSYVTTYY